MSQEEERQALSKRIFIIELFILGIILVLIMWWQGYLFCPESAVKRMIAVYRLRLLYNQGGLWEIIKIIWWATGLIATILLYLSYTAGEITEEMLSRRERKIRSEQECNE